MGRSESSIDLGTLRYSIQDPMFIEKQVSYSCSKHTMTSFGGQDNWAKTASPGVHFTNILWAAFAPKSFCQKITNPNCKHLKAVQRTLVWLSITPIYYEQHFHTKVLCSAFMCLQFGFVIFWQKDFGTKAAHKMLVKLTPGDKLTPLAYHPTIKVNKAE